MEYKNTMLVQHTEFYINQTSLKTPKKTTIITAIKKNNNNQKLQLSFVESLIFEISLISAKEYFKTVITHV